MQAREYLEQIGSLQARAKLKLKQIQALRDSLVISSPPTDAEHVSHTRDVDVMGRRISAIVDAEAGLDAVIDQLVDLKREVIMRLNRIGDTQKELYLTERYLNLHTPAEIAEEYHVTARWVRSVLSDGLNDLQAQLDSET